MSVNISSLCIGMNNSGVTKWLRIDVTASSLHDMFAAGAYIPTELGRTAWKEFASGSYLQDNCNREGINVKRDGNKLRIRIGILGNNEDECRSPDSEIALGGTYTSCGTSVDRSLICYILIQ